MGELVSRGDGQRCGPGHGRIMKEWIALRGENTARVALAQEAYRFVKQTAA